MKLIQCPNCAERIVEIGEICPNCKKIAKGEYINYFEQDISKRKNIQRVIGIIILSILFIAFSIVVTLNVLM